VVEPVKKQKVFQVKTTHDEVSKKDSVKKPVKVLQEKPQKSEKKDKDTQKSIQTVKTKEQNKTKKSDTTLLQKKQVSKKEEKKEKLNKTQNIKKLQKDIVDLLSKKPIFFKFGSDKLSKKGEQAIDSIITLLKKEEIGYNIMIKGHTDGHGDERYNRILSQKRADAVKQYIQKHFDRIESIKSIGYGSSKPKYKNKKDKRNRRVEIIIDRGTK